MVYNKLILSMSIKIEDAKFGFYFQPNCGVKLECFVKIIKSLK